MNPPKIDLLRLPDSLFIITFSAVVPFSLKKMRQNYHQFIIFASSLYYSYVEEEKKPYVFGLPDSPRTTQYENVKPNHFVYDNPNQKYIYKINLLPLHLSSPSPTIPKEKKNIQYAPYSNFSSEEGKRTRKKL